jgi:hypothetical protein
MAWLKKKILFILSAVLIVFASCENVRNKSAEKQKEGISKEKLVNSFFSHIQNWSDQSVPLIDSLGNVISQMDSALSYLPYKNDYEKHAFLFTAKNKGAFKIFEESDLLSQSEAIQQSSYKVWRKELNNLKVLDFSIEPHPTLNWIFVIRLRSQE